MAKKVAVIGTVGLPANYGGFETLVDHLIINKNSEFKFTVYCSKHAYTEKYTSYNNAQLKYIPLRANGIQSIPYDIISIFHALLYMDILLVLGVSGGLIFPIVKLISNKKIIVNIDGVEWQRHKWGWIAKKFLKISEWVAVKYADIIVADNKVIQDRIRETFGKDSELITYGANHSKCVKIRQNKHFKLFNDNYAFKVCRIEPENNIEMIIRAFISFRKLNLVLVGNWNSSLYAQELREMYKNEPNIFLLDPIYDQVDLDSIRSNCYIYIHGHSAGGTNPSLVEAMYLQLPILAFDVNYNRETTGNKALYFDDENSLVNLLNTLTEDRLNDVAFVLKQIADEKYTWEIISEKYARIFNQSEVVVSAVG